MKILKRALSEVSRRCAHAVASTIPAGWRATLMVMLASGGSHLSDLGAVHEQEPLFEKLPAEAVAEAEIVLRADSATHDLFDWVRKGGVASRRAWT